jgi:O-antigen/teichoic acid export membrane protein
MSINHLHGGGYQSNRCRCMISAMKLIDRAFTWGSRAMRTDLRSLARAGSWMTISQAITSLIAFGLSILFARFFPKEEFGVYRYVLSVVGLASAFSLTGLSTAIVPTVASGNEGLFRRSFWLSVRWSIPAMLCSGTMSAYYFINGNQTLGWSLLIASVLQPMINAALLFRSYLNGKQYYKTLAVSNVIMVLIPALALGTVLFVSKDPIIMTLTYFLSTSIVAISVLGVIRHHYKPNTKELANDHVYSKHMSILNIIDVIATNIDRVLLFNLIGGTAVSVYTFAVAMPEQIRNLYKIIPLLAIPKFAQRSLIEIKSAIHQKIRSVLLLSTIITGVYIAAAPTLFRVLFPAYLESVHYSQLFVLILLAEGSLSNAVFKAHRAVREQYIVSISSNIIKILLLITCTFLWGIWGIIIARIISRYVGFLIALFLVTKLRINNSLE